MATATGCSWEEWLALPEATDGQRYELIDGALVVSPSPGYRHQRVLNLVQTDLTNWAWEHGGQVLPGPFDVYVTEGNYYEPDLIYVRPERVNLIGERGMPAAPDLVVEVSSPTTRDRDLQVKRVRYAQAGVREYWFVDLDADQLLAYRHDEAGEGGDEAALVLGRGDSVESVAAVGFSMAVARLLDA